MNVVFPSFALMKRELISLLRKPWVFAVLLLYLLITNVASTIFWPGDDEFVFSSPRDIFAAIITTLVILVILVIPSLAATAIISEKDGGTFEELLMTLITPRGIVYGKILNFVGVSAIIFVVSLPLLGVLLYMGGGDYVRILVAFVSLLFLTVNCSAWGLFASATHKTSQIATPLCFVFLGFGMMGLPFLLECFLREPYFQYNYELSYYMEFLKSLTEPPFVWWIDSSYGELVPRIMYQFAFSIFIAELAVRKIRRQSEEITVPESGVYENAPDPMNPKKKGETPFAQATSGQVLGLANEPVARRKRERFYMANSFNFLKKRWTTTENINDNVNPILFKDLIYTSLNNWALLVIALLLHLLISFALFFAPFTPICYLFPILIAVPGIMMPAIAREYTRGNMDMLRMTILTPRQIILGKFSTATITSAPAFFGIAIALCCTFFQKIERPNAWIECLLLFPITTATCFFTSLSLATLSAVLIRNSAKTAVLSYLLNLFLFVGLPVISIITFGLLEPFINNGIIGWDYRVNLISPLVSYFAFFELDVSEAIFSFTFSHVFFWILALVFMRMSISLFERKHMRDA